MPQINAAKVVAKAKAELERIRGIDQFCPTSPSRESALRYLCLELIEALERSND